MLDVRHCLTIRRVPSRDWRQAWLVMAQRNTKEKGLKQFRRGPSVTRLHREHKQRLLVPQCAPIAIVGATEVASEIVPKHQSSLDWPKAKNFLGTNCDMRMPVSLHAMHIV